MNTTLEKFGYPDSVIYSYQFWTVLLRPQQVTLGALILGANDQSTRFSALSGTAMTELSTVINDIENSLTYCFDYDKINYLMLMMVDPHVHFHVIPRYETSRMFDSLEAHDDGWPGPPNLAGDVGISPQQHVQLLNYLRENWVADK